MWVRSFAWGTCIVRRWTKTLQDFSDDKNGSVAVVCGLSFLVLCLCMGVAFDSARLHNVTSRVQSALDSAALAAAKLLDEDTATDAQVVERAQTFFDAHRDDIKMDGLKLEMLDVTPDRVNSTVHLKIKGSLSSLTRSLLQQSPALDFVRDTTTTYKTKKIELSLVVDVTGSMSAGGKIDSLKLAAKDLVDTLFATNPNPGAIRLALVPYSASVNAGAYRGAATNAPFSFDTCVVERSGSENATDAPASGGAYLGTSNNAANSRYSCPTAQVEPLTDLWDPTLRTAFKNRIDALSPGGATAGHIGLAWGWYFLSSKWASLWPAAQRPKPADPDITKAVILMTDGEFNTSYLAGNTNSTDYLAQDSSGDQTLTLCDNMKKAGSDILIFTIGFQAPANAEAMLRACSGNANFFDANNAGDLISAFREIAERLTSLRISS